MTPDQDEPQAQPQLDPAFQPPRVVLGIDRGYEPVTETDFAPGERQLVEAIISVGLDMRDDQHIRRPCIIPPAVALAIVRSALLPPLIHRAKQLQVEAAADRTIKPGEF